MTTPTAVGILGRDMLEATLICRDLDWDVLHSTEVGGLVFRSWAEAVRELWRNARSTSRDSRDLHLSGHEPIRPSVRRVFAVKRKRGIHRGDKIYYSDTATGTRFCSPALATRTVTSSICARD
jgi:hypothetical protein